MKRLMASAVMFASCVAAHAGTQFEVGGIKVTMAEDGWEVRDGVASPAHIGQGGIAGVIRKQAKVLTLRRTDGTLVATLLVSGDRGANQQVRVAGGCPEVPAERFYARSMAKSDNHPPQCLLVTGPLDGPRAVREIGALKDLRDSLAGELAVPLSSYMVVAFAVNALGSEFEVRGLVDVGFAGVSGKQPLGTPPDNVPPAMAAWSDALGAAVSKALDGVFSRSTT